MVTIWYICLQFNHVVITFTEVGQIYHLNISITVGFEELLVLAKLKIFHQILYPLVLAYINPYPAGKSD